ncbi:hypothetical protein [Actinocrispum wychmicini]|uniref:Small secreted protein n=1 Tax=Actinocrispum wychmicini TaxID=1213861 RepID=A0A4R2JB31_9PSEU|nr:hypothetical protein [Actinocrispum wychmicini]TCO56024.1 hypothetical protein EV192_107449 [Actinocrispum wychmicini]
MRHRLAMTGVSVVGVAVVLAGCSSSADEEKTVAWADRVCGVSIEVRDALAKAPTLDQSDPAALKKGLVEFAGARVSALDKAVKDLDGLKSGPHADSAKLVSAESEVYAKARTSAQHAKSLAEAADPTAEKFTADITAAANELDAIKKSAADAKDTKVASDLADARNKAANCKKLDGQ